jgi:hypothetical protein
MANNPKFNQLSPRLPTMSKQGAQRAAPRTAAAEGDHTLFAVIGNNHVRCAEHGKLEQSNFAV